MIYKMNNKIVCTNCGKMNHIFKDCKEPLTSYGLICFRKFKEINKDDLKIIMVRRKDTIGYVEFLRGKYDINDENYILQLLNLMTKDEKNLIKSVNDFDKLRELLGMTKKNSIYRQEYDNAKIKFNKLKENIINNKSKLFTLIDESVVKWNECEWGLPKGRKNQKETNLNCGIREFLEETNIDKNNISIFYNVKPIEEIYTSINNIKYRHIYYFAMYTNENTLLEINPNNKNQITEIDKLNWYNLDESINKIREYYIEKKNIIKKTFKIIEKINKIVELNDLISV